MNMTVLAVTKAPAEIYQYSLHVAPALHPVVRISLS